MSNSRSNQIKYRNISITTVLVLVISFSYYYFIYVRNNENKFNDKAFRIIENVGENIENKFDNYAKTVENAMDHLIKFEYNAVKGKSTKDLRELFTKYGVPKELEIISFQVIPKSEDGKIAHLLRANKSTTLKGDSISIYLTNNEYSIRVRYKIDKLLEYTLRRDFFKDYLLFSDAQVFYNDIPVERTKLIKLDTIFKKEKGELVNLFHSTDRVELEFENKPQLMYVRPLNLSDDKTLYIGGIIEKGYYTQQSYNLDTNILLALLILLLLLVLSLPFVKIGLINENERINSKDVVFSFGVLIIGAAFITLSLMIFFGQRGPARAERINFLKKYSAAIEKNILNELGDILGQMAFNDSLLAFNSTIDEQNKFRYDVSLPDKGISEFNSKYKYYQNLMWIDKSGNQLVKWQKNPTARISMIIRNYFTYPLDTNNQLWIDDSIKNSSGFFADAIISVTEGKTYAVVSQRTPNSSKLKFDDGVFSSVSSNIPIEPVVLAMVTNLQSMDNLPVPSNVSYMVVNTDGLVIFHENAVKILRENLINETDNNLLREAIYTKIDTTFIDSYDEKDQRFYIKPIGNLPLFLLTYIDEKKEKVNDAQIFLLSSLMYFLLLIIFLFQVTLFVLINNDWKKKIKGKSFFTNWLWPVASKRKIYLLLTYYLLASQLVYILGHLYTNILLSLSFFSLLLTVSLFILRNFKNLAEFYDKSTYFKYPIYFGLMIIFSLLLFLKSDLSVLPFRVILFYLVFLIISVVSIMYSYKVAVFSANSNVRLTYNIWYTLFILTFSSFAVMGFYSKSFNFEKSISLKHMQLSLANKIVSHQESRNNPYKEYKALNPAFLFSQKIIEEAPKMTNELMLLKQIRFLISDDLENSPLWNFEKNKQGGTYYWNESADSLCLLYTDGAKNSKKGERIIISSPKLTIIPSDFLLLDQKFGTYSILLCFSIILFSLLIFLIVNYWTEKIFLLGIIPRLQTNLEKLIQTARYVYIISPPFSGIISFFENKYSDKLYIIDLRFKDPAKIDFPVVVSTNIEAVMILDMESINTEGLEKKIFFIEKLKMIFNDNNYLLKKIIVVSVSSPNEIMRSFKDGNKSELEIVSRYLEIVGDFTTTYFPVGFNSEKVNESDNDFLQKELSFITTLDNQLMTDLIIDPECDSEDIILTIQNKAQLFYYAIWNSFDKQERFVIYDLAQDGLVNYRNLYVIYRLMSRGILLNNNGKIELFNQSFRNFVLTIINREQSLEFELEAKRSGSWSNMKLPLYLAIGGVFVFVFLTQQQVFNEIFGWLTAAGALLGVITKIILSFSTFSGSPKKQ